MSKLKNDIKELITALCIIAFVLTASWLLQPVLEKYIGESIITIAILLIIFTVLRIVEKKNGR